MIASKENNLLKEENDLTSGVSLENAAYFENGINQAKNQDDISIYEEKSKDIPETDTQDEVTTPQLFSDEGVLDSSSEGNSNDEILRDEEEEFEIPAFLRNQKF